MARFLIVALLLIQSSNGVITGRLITAAGAPASGMRVAVRPVSVSPAPALENVQISIAETDASGRYRLDNVPPGRYVIAAGQVGRPTYFPGTIVSADAVVVEVHARELLNISDFTMQSASIATNRPADIAAFLDFKPLHPSPISVDTSGPAADAYELIAAQVGVKVIYDRDFLNTPVQLKLEGVDVYSALNVLSAKLGKFWAPYFGNTILVSDDNSPKRFDNDIRSIDSLLVDGAGNIFFRDSSGLHNLNPKRAQIQVKSSSISLDVSLPTREVFERLISAAGLAAVFTPSMTFRPATVTLKAASENFFDVIDGLTLQTGTLWLPLDARTILVSNNTASAHLDFDPWVYKVFYINTAASAADLTNVAFSLRGRNIGISQINPASYGNAILVRDNPMKVALAGAVISQMLRDDPRLMPVVGRLSSPDWETDSLRNVLVRESSDTQNVSPSRLQLKPSIGEPISLHLRDDAQATYRTVAAKGSIDVRFDSRFLPGSAFDFQIENRNIFDALNMLALQTRSFWQVVDAKTILVAPNTPAIRRELEKRSQKTVQLQNVHAEANIQSLALAVRSAMNLTATEISLVNGMDAIELNTTTNNIELAERLIQALDIPEIPGR